MANLGMVWSRVARTTALSSALVAAGCAHDPKDYPVTQQGKIFTELDATQRGIAPPVASGVTAERIARARSTRSTAATSAASVPRGYSRRA